ncbi:MAG: hypothetical protein NZT92_04115 [Abditibacteriales bacterium]|nr:hypothetical protein [Abditibacteriales bacterium]MDW8365118.1 hypothetical protein [Abditibacteriales bacterium]
MIHGIALSPGEKVLWQGKPSLPLYLRRWLATWTLLPMLWHTNSGLPILYRLIGIPFYLLALLIPFPYLVYLLLKWSRTRYGVTDKRILTFCGKGAKCLPLDQCMHVELVSGGKGDCGTLMFYEDDAARSVGFARLTFLLIPHVREVHDIIENVRRGI